MVRHLPQRIWSRALDAVTGARCPGCGETGTSIPCASCLEQLDAITRAPHAAWSDSGVAARLVRQAKHGHWRGAAQVLATRARARLSLGQVDLVTWVPADRARRAKRGGCFPESLARALARELQAPAVQLLDRVDHGSQKGLGRDARRRNVQGAFRLRGLDRRHAVAGRVVLLVDDVRTTGATLESAAAVLRRAGLVPVTFACVGVDRIRPGASTGAVRCPNTHGNPATCAEFSLTNTSVGADTVEHVQ